MARYDLHAASALVTDAQHRLTDIIKESRLSECLQYHADIAAQWLLVGALWYHATDVRRAPIGCDVICGARAHPDCYFTPSEYVLPGVGTMLAVAPIEPKKRYLLRLTTDIRSPQAAENEVKTAFKTIFEIRNGMIQSHLAHSKLVPHLRQYEAFESILAETERLYA